MTVAARASIGVKFGPAARNTACRRTYALFLARHLEAVLLEGTAVSVARAATLGVHVALCARETGLGRKFGLGGGGASDDKNRRPHHKDGGRKAHRPAINRDPHRV